MAHARKVLFVASLLGLLMLLPSHTSEGAWINILDPTGSLSEGPQQPYGQHNGCSGARCYVNNWGPGGYDQHWDDYCQMDSDEWWYPNSLEFLEAYYQINVFNGTGYPAAYNGGSVGP